MKKYILPIILLILSLLLFYLVNKKEADSSFKTGNSQKATPSDVSTSIFSILRRIKNVKNSFTVDTEETERINNSE